MRFRPVSPEVFRTPIEDDILPLTKPIVGTSGRVYTELPVPKGTSLSIAMSGYNWCAFTLFHTATPSAENSFLLVAGTRICGVQTPMSSDRSVGLKRVRRRNRLLAYMGTCAALHTAVGTLNIDLSSHSSTFSGGPRSCIGWRFACVDRLVQSPKDAEDSI